MKIEVLLFGITRDIIGENKLDLNVDEGITVNKLKEDLGKQYLKLNDFNYSVAVNEVYAENNAILNNKDIVAFIPPVSGG